MINNRTKIIIYFKFFKEIVDRLSFTNAIIESNIKFEIRQYF